MSTINAEYYAVIRKGTLHLKHFGIKGQKWGVRRYQNKDGTLTDAGKKRYYKEYNEAYEYAKNDAMLRDRVENAALNQKKLNDAIRKRKEYYDRGREIENDLFYHDVADPSKLNEDREKQAALYSEMKNSKDWQEGKKLIANFKKEMAKSYSEMFGKDVNDLYGGDSAVAKAIDELLDYNVFGEKKER